MDQQKNQPDPNMQLRQFQFERPAHTYLEELHNIFKFNK